MLYFLGGASRAGKSKLARRLLAERHVPYLSTDVLMMGFANGLPEFGIDPDGPDIAVGEKLWPLIQGMSVNLLENDVAYLVEGAALLPKYVSQMVDRYAPSVRACFIGYAEAEPSRKLDDIRRYGGESNDWVADHTGDQILALVAEMIEYSTYLRAECAHCNLTYIDGSLDFQDALDQAFHCLTAE
jgi:hypothetical protein